MSLIYKIADASSWASALAAGEYAGSAHDLRDGFIHFSTAAQTRATAAKHFADQTGLVISAIETDQLGDELRWEASRGGALFPHLYGPLPMAAVVWTKALPLGEDGVHIFPVEVA